MPLLVEDRAVGVLVLYAAEAGFFDYEELRLLKDLAGDISFALDYIGKEEKLTYVSYYDTLTGLANRQLFFDRLAQALQSVRAERRQLAVMIIDLQRFKRINDTLGRYAGDQVLKELANRLQRTISESATPARIGGDRFAVMVPNLVGTPMARWIDHWIVDAFAEPLVIDGIELRATVKIGIALYPADAETAESLFVNAEAALKRAKDAADPYLFYSPEMNARVAQRLHLESRLRKAVAQKEFVLHYQTKVDLASRQIRGLEALIRWNRSRVRLGGLRCWISYRCSRNRGRSWRSGGGCSSKRSPIRTIGDRLAWRCRGWPSTFRRHSCGIPILSRRCLERWGPPSVTRPASTWRSPRP